MSGIIPAPAGASGPPMAFAFVGSSGAIVGAGASQNIDSVGHPATGTYTVNFSASIFTLQPSCLIQLMDDNGTEERYGYVSAVSSAACTILIYDSTATLTDNRFRFFAVGL